MVLFLCRIEKAGELKPDRPFFKIPKVTNLDISLLIFAFMSSLTENGQMKNGDLSNNSKFICIFGAKPISSWSEKASLYSSKIS